MSCFLVRPIFSWHGPTFILKILKCKNQEKAGECLEVNPWTGAVEPAPEAVAFVRQRLFPLFAYAQTWVLTSYKQQQTQGHHGHPGNHPVNGEVVFSELLSGREQFIERDKDHDPCYCREKDTKNSR